MPTTVGQHAVAAFTSPINGTSPIDATTVRTNDNTLRTSYVSHDADTGIHVQSSALASRPAAGIAGRKWMTEDAGVVRQWYDTGSQWVEVSTASIVDGSIVNADINASAAIADTKLATISSAGKVANSATTATPNNTNNAIVARNSSGNFSAGTITAAALKRDSGNLTISAEGIGDDLLLSTGNSCGDVTISTGNSAGGITLETGNSAGNIKFRPGTGIVVFRKSDDTGDVAVFDQFSGFVLKPSIGAVNIDTSDGLQVQGTKVVGAQGAAVADATDAASVIARLNDLLSRLRAHGLIAT